MDLTARTGSSGERGLLGVAFDPDFGANGFVYEYHAQKASGGQKAHNRIVRFTAAEDRAIAGSERLILRRDDLSRATNHNGGAHELNVNAPTQKIGRRIYVFVSWFDDDPNASHAITILASAATYTSTFRK